MKIRKAKFEEKVWGKEEHIADFPNSGYCGKKLHLNEGYRCSVHRHEKDETFYIEQGKVYFELETENKDMEDAILVQGNIVDIHNCKWHRFSGLEDSVIIEFSTPDTESERKVKSMKIPDFKNLKERVLNRRF